MLTLGIQGPLRALKVGPGLLLAGLLAPAHPLAAGGMLLSAVGDAFLLDKSRFFLHGLAAFLVGHLLFIPAFLGISGAMPAPALVLALLVCAGGLLAVVRPRKPALRIAVPIYALVLVAMVAAASTLGRVGLCGGLLFLLSDAALSIRLFKQDFYRADLLVMLTYYGALLTLSAALG